MEAVDDVLGWDTDGGDEESGLGVDYYADELVELALCVVVAVVLLLAFSRPCLRYRQKGSPGSGLQNVLGLPGTTTNLR